MVRMTVSAHDYHADNLGTPAPSLTASIANILINQSPAHARAAHPRLNPNFRRVDEDKFSLGTAVHSLLLEGLDVAHVVHADSWRTAAAKEARDEATAHGRIPLLAHQHAEAVEMVEAIRSQLATLKIDPPPFTNGQPEQTIMWEEDGIWCRARVDWLHDDKRTIDDLKTTRASAHPEKWTRTMLGMGAELQARFYVRGIKHLHGYEPAFRFVVAECQPPFALSVVGLTPSLAALADAKVDRAIRLWRQCVETDTWPAYGDRVAYIDAPPWAEAQFLEAEARDEVAA